MLHRKEVDMVAIPAVMTDERLQIGHFLHPFYISDLTILSGVKKGKTFDLENLHIQTNIYYIFITFFVFVALTITVLDRYSNKEANVPKSNLSLWERLSFQFFNVLATALGKGGTNYNPMQSRTRILIAGWLLGMFVLITTATSLVTSAMTIIDYEVVDTVSKLARRTDMCPYLAKGGEAEASFSRSLLKERQTIWKRVKLCGTSIPKSFLERQDIVNEVLANKAAVINDRLCLKHTVHTSCSDGKKLFRIASEEIREIMLGLAVRFGYDSLFYEMLNLRMSQFLQGGHFNYAIQKSTMRAERCLLLERIPCDTVTFEELQTTFCVLMAGYGLALAILTAECLIAHKSKETSINDVTQCVPIFDSLPPPIVSLCQKDFDPSL